MKLIFVIKSVDSPGGGAERVLSDIVGELARRKHDVTVLTSDAYNGASFYQYPDTVEIIRSGLGKTGRPATFSETLRRLMFFRSTVISRKPDVVIGFMHSTYLPLGLALIGLGIPVVGSEHTVYEHYRSRPFQKLLLRFSPLLLRRMTVISEAVRQGYPLSIRKRMFAIVNPVSLPVSINASNRKCDKNRKIILAVGRFAVEKDYATLILAFARLAPSFPDWNLRIVGDGPLRQQLEKLILSLGVSGRVELPGLIKNVAVEYAAADVFAVPSLYESFGLSTAEALAHSLPSIGFSYCEGTNELILNEINGVLVGAGNRIDQLANGLERLMCSDVLRSKLARAGSDTVKQFSLSGVCDQWENLLSMVRALDARG